MIRYAIIGAECQSYYSDSEAVKNERREAVRKLNETYRELYHEDRDVFSDENVLILWKNNPDRFFVKKYLADWIECLIENFCRRIDVENEHGTRFEDEDAVFAELYIDSPFSLQDDTDSKKKEDDQFRNMFIVLKRLLLIYKQSGLVPYIMRDNFILETKREDLNAEFQAFVEEQLQSDAIQNTPEEAKELVKRAARERLEKEAIRKIDRTHFIRFFNSIETMLAMEQMSVSDKKEKTFIEYYMMWQRDEKGVDTCFGELGISNNTWYANCDKLEQNFLYPEYINAFADRLRGCKIKPFRIEEVEAFMNQYEQVLKETWKSMDGTYDMSDAETELGDRKACMEVYHSVGEIKSLWDVNRYAYTCMDKIKVRK